MQKRKYNLWTILLLAFVAPIGYYILYYLLIVHPFIEQITFIIQANDRERYVAEYKSKTTPLAAEVVLDMCNKLGLPAQDSRCQPGAIVYAPQFFDVIKSYVRNLPPGSSNQEEVDELLGKYKISYETPHQYRDLSVRYRCLYDLHGDDVSIIGVYFINGEINVVHASMGGS